MKDFKLRLWDPQEKTMRYSDTWGNLPWSEVNAAQEENRLMVSSGLLDIEGRLLYEGDIVHVYNAFKENHYTAQILFRNAQFILETELLTNHSRWINYELTYMGNVFETPSLLAEETP